MGKKGGVFKEIEVGFSDLNKRIEVAKKKKDESKLELCDKQLKALNQVAEYVFSYTWVKKDKVKLILEDIHLNNYDYTWVAEKYGMSKNEMKCFVYRNMNIISEKIGSHTLELILSSEDKVNLGLLSFRLASGQIKLEDMFIQDLLNKVPKAKEHYFKLENCIEELRFLYNYTKFMMDFSFSQLDKEKLEFVMWLLSSPTDHYKVQQKDLIAAMLGKNLTMDEFIDSLVKEKKPFENDEELREKYDNFAYSVEEKVVEEVQEVQQIDEVQEVESIQEVDEIVEEVTEEVAEEFVEFEDIENVNNEEDFVDFEDVEVEEEKDYDFGEDILDFVEEDAFEEENSLDNEEEVLDFVEESPKAIKNDIIDLSIYSDFEFEDDFENDNENTGNVEENLIAKSEDLASEKVEEEEEEDIDLFRDSEDEEPYYKNNYEEEIKEDDDIIIIEEDDNSVIIEEEDETEEDLEEKQKAELDRLEEEGYLMGMPDDMDNIEHTVVKESKPKFDMSGFSQSYGKPKQQFKPNIQKRMSNFGGNTQNNFNKNR